MTDDEIRKLMGRWPECLVTDHYVAARASGGWWAWCRHQLEAHLDSRTTSPLCSEHEQIVAFLMRELNHSGKE